MSNDEQEIRALIERWTAAVHGGELETVLRDHSSDIVMFDVPPPYEGVRGLDAYRETWPGFFEWQASGAIFELVSLEVTAGTDVAFAHALLKCGPREEFDDGSPNRLRLTLGLRKEDGRWVVTHEHHSFPSTETAPEVAESAVREVHDQWSERTAANDLDGLMEAIDDDVVSYEYGGPLEYVGKEAVRELCAAGLATGDKIEMSVPELTVKARDDLAVAWGLTRIVVDGSEENWSRSTRVFQRQRDGWKMIHQHLSLPAS